MTHRLRHCPLAYLLTAALLSPPAVTLCAAGESAQVKPPEMRLAAEGKALLPVVVAADAPPRVRQAAQALADYLGRISGARFEVTAGDGTAGLAVGLPAHFPALALGKLWDASDPTQREDYLLRSHTRGVHLVGAA